MPVRTHSLSNLHETLEDWTCQSPNVQNPLNVVPLNLQFRQTTSEDLV